MQLHSTHKTKTNFEELTFRRQTLFEGQFCWQKHYGLTSKSKQTTGILHFVGRRFLELVYGRREFIDRVVGHNPKTYIKGRFNHICLADLSLLLRFDLIIRSTLSNAQTNLQIVRSIKFHRKEIGTFLKQPLLS